jgi:hypothetical protein
MKGLPHRAGWCAWQDNPGAIKIQGAASLRYRQGFPLHLRRSFPEHLKVTILRGFSIMDSPVDGLRPLRAFFSLMQNFPKPEIRTSSPEARVDFMISRIRSTAWTDFALVKPTSSTTFSTMCAFVRLILAFLLE